MIKNQEIWKEIPGWEGYYSVSTYGNIKSLDRVITEKNSGKSYQVKGKALTPNVDREGRLRASLSKAPSIKTIYIHTLILLTFTGPKPSNTECCHKDGNPKNNHIDNLYYGTRAQNIADAKRHGTFPMGEKRPGAILTPEKAVLIYQKGRNGESSHAIAKEFNIKTGTVNQILRGETWKEHTGGVSLKRTLYRFPFLTEAEKLIVLDETKSFREIASILKSDRHIVSKWRKKLKGQM